MLIPILLIVGFAALVGYLFLAASAEIERRHERWLWEHPPEEEAVREEKFDE